MPPGGRHKHSRSPQASPHRTEVRMEQGGEGAGALPSARQQRMLVLAALKVDARRRRLERFLRVPDDVDDFGRRVHAVNVRHRARSSPSWISLHAPSSAAPYPAAEQPGRQRLTVAGVLAEAKSALPHLTRVTGGDFTVRSDKKDLFLAERAVVLAAAQSFLMAGYGRRRLAASSWRGRRGREPRREAAPECSRCATASGPHTRHAQRLASPL